MSIEFEPNQPNIDAYRDVVDVYNEDEITSFVMLDNEVCRVIDGPAGLLVTLLDIEVA